jgi:CTP:molybdopterin cytidylyltransferase MocA
VTAAILLCAGGSARFTGEQHKLVAPFRGRPLVAWALEHVRDAGFDELIVVVGAIDLTPWLGDDIAVMNSRWTSGQASSLQAGIAEADRRGHDVVVVGLGDQPLVPADAWKTVATAAGPIAVANFDGQRTPPVRLDREVWSLLATEGDVGARELLRDQPDLVHDVAVIGDPLDIDTVDDLTTWG